MPNDTPADNADSYRVRKHVRGFLAFYSRPMAHIRTRFTSLRMVKRSATLAADDRECTRGPIVAFCVTSIGIITALYAAVLRPLVPGDGINLAADTALTCFQTSVILGFATALHAAELPIGMRPINASTAF